MKQNVVIIDYGMGNLGSISHALSYLGVKHKVSSCVHEVAVADTIILPGVGSFRSAMERLIAKNFDAVLWDHVMERKKKILGICLGMQLFAEYGDEDGGARGLSFMKGRTEYFLKEKKYSSLKVPHVGFNSVEKSDQSLLLRGLPETPDFYFTHSYRIIATNKDAVISQCTHGHPFVASVERDNLFATQFHPEKSQSNGLKLLNNFIRI